MKERLLNTFNTLDVVEEYKHYTTSVKHNRNRTVKRFMVTYKQP